MLQMGDEMRRTQHGNNNAYCQDNDVSWLDWSLLDRHRDLHRFVRTLIGYRRRMMGARSEESFELSLKELLRRAEFDWHGVRLGKPDWADDSHSIACTIRASPAAPSVVAACDDQRILGGARFRPAPDARSTARRVVAMDRYGAKIARGHHGCALQRRWCAGRNTASRRAPSLCCLREPPTLPFQRKACRQHTCESD